MSISSVAAICLIAGLAAAETPSETATELSQGTLTVDVKGLKSDSGQVRFVLFDSEDNYLKQAFRSGTMPIVDGRCEWVVDDLPYGDYALAVHHDVNGNGKMERHWYGKPKEPGGFSNDAPAKFGPAKYKKAKFNLSSSAKSIEVTVK